MNIFIISSFSEHHKVLGIGGCMQYSVDLLFKARVIFSPLHLFVCLYKPFGMKLLVTEANKLNLYLLYTHAFVPWSCLL